MSTATLPAVERDPVKLDTKHYKVESETDCFRIIRVKYGPKEKSPMHQHLPGVTVMLTDANFRFTYPDGCKEELHKKAGEDQRFFDGMVWVDKKEYNIVRMEGRAVPEIRSTKSENLFPRFTTIRKPIDGKHWFPIYTYADDVLQFRSGPQRERLRIAYSNY